MVPTGPPWTQPLTSNEYASAPAADSNLLETLLFFSLGIKLFCGQKIQRRIYATDCLYRSSFTVGTRHF